MKSVRFYLEATDYAIYIHDFHEELDSIMFKLDEQEKATEWLHFLNHQIYLTAEANRKYNNLVHQLKKLIKRSDNNV